MVHITNLCYFNPRNPKYLLSGSRKQVQTPQNVVKHAVQKEFKSIYIIYILLSDNILHGLLQPFCTDKLVILELSPEAELQI